MLKRALIGTGAVAALWEASVAYRRSRPPEDENFRIGTTDDLLMDNLKSGDIVFFSRHWTTEHLPFMLLHQLYKTAHKTDVDHCGILVQDHLGRLHVFERSYAGVKLRPFPARVNWSKARLILVRPRADELPREQRRALWQYATERQAEEGSDRSYFWKQMQYVITTLTRGEDAKEQSASVCYDSLLVVDALRSIAPASSNTKGFVNAKELLEEQSEDYLDAAVPVRTW